VATAPRPDELLGRVERLTALLDELGDDPAAQLAGDLVAAVVAMYGDGLERIVAAIAAQREAGAEILDRLAQDGAVASLLLIHDLYPVPLEQRVREALDTVRPYMESHGGGVELRSLEDGVARLALRGSCDGCAASRATLELAIEQALAEHAPDLAGLEVEGVAPPPRPGRFELPLHEPAAAPPRAPRWVELGAASGVGPGELRALAIDEEPLVLAGVGGSLLAYRDVCAACGGPLHGGELDGHVLRCPGCRAEFDLRRAGRAAAGEGLQLTPVPLLEAGGVRVAV
jgi:Fe-S cluster biogenesis protein NfuA/nitrite reductase/ring-hydroxylating ferredoxin subunit